MQHQVCRILSATLILLSVAAGTTASWAEQTSKSSIPAKPKAKKVLELTYKIEGFAKRGGSDSVATRNQIQNVLKQRADLCLGVKVTHVSIQGQKVVVKLEDYTNVAKAIATIGVSGNLECYHARTVGTEKQTSRPYLEAGSLFTISDWSFNAFVRRDAQQRQIVPGQPEYRKIIQSWGAPILNPKDFANVSLNLDANSNPILSLQFTPSGTKKFNAFLRSVNGQAANVAFTFDQKVFSMAPMRMGVQVDGSMYLEGLGDAARKQLVGTFKAGPLPVKLKQVSHRIIEAKK